jgi:hypothetical protein
MDPTPVSGVLVLAGEKAIEESKLPDPAAAAAALAYACPGEIGAERSASDAGTPTPCLGSGADGVATRRSVVQVPPRMDGSLPVEVGCVGPLRGGARGKDPLHLCNSC